MNNYEIYPDSIKKEIDGKVEVLHIDRLAVMTKIIDTLIIHGGCYSNIDFENCVIKNLIIDGNIFRNTSNMFTHCKIKNLKFDPNAEVVSKECFFHCEIENLNLGNVKIIGPSAFEYSTIRNINWSNELLVIHASAFQFACLPDMILPESLRYIGFNTFNVAKIKSLTFNKKLPAMEFNTFHHVSILESNYEIEKIIHDENRRSLRDVNITIDGKLYMALDIKSEIVDYETEKIMPYAYEIFKFGNNKDILKRIEFKELKELSPCCFESTSIEEIEFPKEVKTIPGFCFKDSMLAEINLENIEKIERNAFSNAFLEDVNLKSLKHLESYAFSNNCFEKINIPGTVDVIPKYCFEYNPLYEITLNDGIKCIDTGAFGACHTSKISLPNTLNEIQYLALSFSLETLNKCTIKIPLKVTKLNPNFTNYNYSNILMTAELYDKIKDEIEPDDQKAIEIYTPSLEELIEADYTTSEINQFYKAIENNTR